MPKKIKKNQSIKLKRLILVSIWLVLGTMVGVFIPWYLYLNSLVKTQFIEHQWTVPSSVYSSEVSLFQGKQISQKQIIYHLEGLGYSRVSQVKNLGDYSVFKSKIEIYTKGYKFPETDEVPKKVLLQIQNNKINSIQPNLARLEPMLIGQFYSKDFNNRQPISLREVPEALVKGLQAVEDRSFKNHKGVDAYGILRALVKNIFAGRVVQGGSTITQQLIKNRFNYSGKTWSRKLNEALTAIILENRWGKYEILESYFNEIYWGQSGNLAIHGIQQAANFYFSKQVKQLSIAEQALLIAIVKGPSWYNPSRQPERALKRRNLVLNVWHETGVITNTEWVQAKSKAISLKQNSAFSKSTYADFLDLVELQLLKQFTQADLNQQGLKIYTTLNPFIQQELSHTLVNKTSQLGTELQASGVIINPINGDLLAIKGSSQETTFFNRAINTKRQIGSLIKPFVYLAALKLDEEFNMWTNLSDTPIELPEEDGSTWSPKNYDGQSLGNITAEEALYLSRNQATVNLGLKIGVKTFINYLKTIGLNINHSQYPSIFLGSTELTPLEVTHLYLILATSGELNQVSSIKHITTSDYQLMKKSQVINSINIDSIDADQINNSLNKATQLGTAKSLKIFNQKNNPLYGKTGTTNSGKNSWFVGYNKNYLATFWVGKDNNTATQLTGSTGALKLWKEWYFKMIE